jgi:hypothetical protein
VTDLQSGSYAYFLLRTAEIQGTDLVLDLAVEGSLPELLVCPDGMILDTCVGVLLHPG